MTRNLDPIRPDEYEAVLKAMLSTEPPFQALSPQERARTLTAIKTLWWTGCHPSVVSTYKGGPPIAPTARQEVDGTWEMRWRRPKTNRQMRSRIPPDLGQELVAFLAGPKIGYYALWGRLRAASKIAKLPRSIHPMLFRHRVGLAVFKDGGPGAARGALGVSDRVLKDYTALSDDLAVDAAWKAVGGKG